MQDSDSNQGPEQLYVGNGKGVTKELLLKGKAEGGIYSFDNLVVSRISQNPHLTMFSHTPVPSSSATQSSRNVIFTVFNKCSHKTTVNSQLNKTGVSETGFPNPITYTNLYANSDTALPQINLAMTKL
ncbi:hypothetical protein PIB30_078681 [Stylosanthes scabra]|uniref:Uncharacterized protein n=1 Tax=Stylosanthes scabra TaxID=79078 RepID=A0ABU6VS44_9FABA|nr:hypothetical protein [Stylosanthes scabra]